ncbi:MAG: hypothetical protein JRN15_01935 [Nitrososphaerota archaeon]|nr:hypothetical protein [Nitrososphaerota archaeon]
MKTRRLIGFLIMIPCFVFWLYAVGGASHAGFFADAYDYQVIIMGGALSTIAALLLNIEALDI